VALTTARRGTWNGDPAKAGELFRVHTTRCGRQLQATCELWTHPSGWEIRLMLSDGQLQRSAVYGSHDAVLEASEAWKRAMVERGWV
jgi:hypothetical protein